MADHDYTQYSRNELNREYGSQDIFEYIDFRNVLFDLIEGLMRFWLPILLSMSIAATAGFLYEKCTYKPVYRCIATFFVDVNNPIMYEDSTLAEKAMSQIAITFPYVINNDVLKIIIMEEFGVNKMPGDLYVTTMSDTNLITIQAVADTPEVAYKLLQTVLDNYPRIAKKIMGNTTMKMVGESGMPDEPVNRDKAKKMAVQCLMACLAAWSCLVFLYSIFKTTIRKEEDFQNLLNINCYGSIPKVKFKKRSNTKNNVLLVNQRSVGYGFTESIRSLRTRLDRDQKDYHSKVYMISSSLPGEGKSTVTANLAFSFAEIGRRVILIDMDFRNPSIYKVLGIEEKQKGFADAVLDNIEIERAFLKYEGDTSFFIIPPGKKIDNIGRLLNNKNVEIIMKKLRQKADIILIDTAPSGFLSETISVAKYADVGVFVVHQDYAPVERIRESIEMLSETGLRMGGCILNMSDHGPGIYRQGYGGGYDSKYK